MTVQIVTQKYLKRLDDVEVWLDKPAHASVLSEADDFAAERAQLTTDIADIKAAALSQGQSGGLTSGRVVTKSHLLLDMRHDLETIARGARAVDRKIGGFSTDFRLPASWGEASTAGAARLFAANLGDAAKLQALVMLGMKSATASELIADSALYDQLFKDKADARQARIEDTDDLDKAIAASSATVDTLDAIVHFKFEGDQNAIKSWKEARRLEKMRAHRGDVTP